MMAITPTWSSAMGKISSNMHPSVFQSEQGQKPSERSALTEKTSYPVFNLIDRAAKETGLTRPTLNEIFRRLSEKRKEAIFYNPEGFAGLFIGEINNALKTTSPSASNSRSHPLQLNGAMTLKIFPAEKEFPQKELVEGYKASLYDQVQFDSDVEERFVRNS